MEVSNRLHFHENHYRKVYMTWKDKRNKNDWRSHLTDDEAVEINLLEAEMKALAEKRSRLSKERQLIQNRATTRSRHRATQ